MEIFKKELKVSSSNFALLIQDLYILRNQFKKELIAELHKSTIALENTIDKMLVKASTVEYARKMLYQTRNETLMTLWENMQEIEDQIFEMAQLKEATEVLQKIQNQVLKEIQ